MLIMRITEYSGDSGDVAQRLEGTHVLSAEEGAKYTVKFWLAGKDGWDPGKVIGPGLRPSLRGGTFQWG